MISIVLWTKNFIHKHHLMKTVQDRADEMVSQVNNFKQVFKELFEDGLPSFWDEEGRMFSQEHYHSLLVQSCMEHSKFDDLEKSLIGKAIVDKLTEDFEILQKFLLVRRGLPKVSYEAYMELEVSIREMMECHTPSAEQWKAMERFGKTKYILHS